MIGEAAQADVVTVPSRSSLTFAAPHGCRPVTVPAPVACRLVVIVAEAGYIGDVSIQLGMN